MVEADRQFTVRKYRPEDRETVRRLCCETGFLGRPIDPVFEDRELFADYLTGYYTDHEPESAWVLEVDGEVRGYLLGSRCPERQRRYSFYQNISLFLRGILRYPRYGEATKAYVRWILTRGRKEVPEAPRDCPHFHINLLPDARKVATTRAIMDAYLRYLHEAGETQVYGQMVTYEGRRGERMFERYGFRVLNKSRVTKFDDVHSEPVYLCTVIKDLTTNRTLYAPAQ